MSALVARHEPDGGMALALMTVDETVEPGSDQFGSFPSLLAISPINCP